MVVWVLAEAWAGGGRDARSERRVPKSERRVLRVKEVVADAPDPAPPRPLTPEEIEVVRAAIGWLARDVPEGKRLVVRGRVDVSGVGDLGDRVTMGPDEATQVRVEELEQAFRDEHPGSLGRDFSHAYAWKSLGLVGPITVERIEVFGEQAVVRVVNGCCSGLRLLLSRVGGTWAVREVLDGME